METDRYRLLISVDPAGVDPTPIHAALAALFNRPAARIAEQLAQGPIAINETLSLARGKQVRAHIEALGARCELVPVAPLMLQPDDAAAEPESLPEPLPQGVLLRRDDSPAFGEPQPVASRTTVRLLFVLAFCAIGLSLWRGEQLPPGEPILEPLAREPEQTGLELDPFQTRAGGVEYTVRPLFAYELHGLVVSAHDSRSWWDYLHAASNDHLNAVDLCVVWGANTRPELLESARFSSGQFTCLVEPASSEAAAAFNPAQLSNNHLLTDRPEVARALRSVRVGDQIRFRGYLAEYTHDHGFHFSRGTSTVRTDTGNSACETVFVTDFERLRRGNVVWRLLLWPGLLLLPVAVWAWWRVPLRER